MKKLFLTTFVALSALMANAQGSVTNILDTQARLLDANSVAYVNPLVCELEVQKDNQNKPIRIDKELTLSRVQFEALGRDLANVRSWAVYQICKQYKCDVLVAGTFCFQNIEDNKERKEKNADYKVQVIGFPSNFVNWQTAKPSDYEWMRMEKVQTTSDFDKTHAIVKGSYIEEKK